MFPEKLRTKFLLALALITALVTAATLLTVRARVQDRVRQQIAQDLDGSINTFHALQQQRELALERSAALLASLPPLMAVMTSQDNATIQDASGMFWELSGSQLFALADPQGNLLALHTRGSDMGREQAQAALKQALEGGRSRDWWFADGHLFQIFVNPISFGARPDSPQVGVLALGFEVDQDVATNVARAAASQVMFRFNGQLAATTLDRGTIPEWAGVAPETSEMKIGGESFLVRSVQLGSSDSPPITLTVLKSFDEATQFLDNLNHWILGVGLVGVLAGGLMVFWVSTTFTRPLAELVESVRALEAGNFQYPLRARGRDEVSVLTAAFDRMRGRFLESQQQLLAAERLATIGRMASSISHDLRHPLTAIQAYAEFLSEPSLTEAQRKDFFQEIRIAVDRMTEELNSMLGFSKQAEQIRPVEAQLDEVIERAIQTVKVLPEFEKIQVRYLPEGDQRGRFDAGKIERVILNLLFNACEAAPKESGVIEISSRLRDEMFEVRVADNGPGIPAEVLANLFQPFVSHGKEHGIGLGLTVVQKIIHDHGGSAEVERSSSQGATFLLRWPVSCA